MFLIEYSKFERVYKTIKIILIHHNDLMYVLFDNNGTMCSCIQKKLINQNIICTDDSKVFH